MLPRLGLGAQALSKETAHQEGRHNNKPPPSGGFFTPEPMTNYIQHIKDLLGMANGLSTEQKHDLVKAGLQAAPAGTAGVGASITPTVTESTFLGFAPNTWVVFASLFFISLQIAHLLWKWRRQAKIDAARTAAGLHLESLEK